MKVFKRRLYLAQTSDNINVLGKLSRIRDWRIAYWVAYNKNTSSGILDRLSRRKNKYIKLLVLSHKNVPIRALRRLKEDSDPFVGGQAIERLYTKLSADEVYSCIVQESVSHVV